MLKGNQRKLKRKVTFHDESHKKIDFSEAKGSLKLSVLTASSSLYILNISQITEKLA